MSDEKHIGWMYEGAKAAVNREDYLLGKRIDKNFEKYSDAVVDEKAEGVDRVVHSRVLPSASGSASAKISSLDVNIVRTEDPLVAFKVREETRRREMMENPVMRMKMEKAIKAMMAKKLGSGAKKEKRKKKKKHSKKGSRDSSSDSDDEEPSKKKTKKDKTHKAERKQSESKKHSSSESESQSTVEESSKRVKERRKSHSHEASVRRDRNGDDRRHYHKRSHHSRESTHTDKRRSRSRSRSPFVQSRSRSRHDSVDKKEGRYRRDRQSPECSEGRRRQSGHRRERDSSSESDNKQRSYGMELPQHPHNSRSSSRSASHSPRFDREESERKKRFEGYGLVGVVKKKTDDNEESTSTDNPYKLQKLPAAAPYQKSSRTRPLTEREKEEKLREMQENAKWRTDQRSKNLRKAEEADIEEDLEDDRAKPASFIRPMMNSANEGMSVEQRLKANKKGLQRDHGYMERSFTKR